MVSLKQATGENWFVELAGPMEVSGVQTLAEQLASLARERRVKFKKHPMVKKVLDHFPGAEVVDIH